MSDYLIKVLLYSGGLDSYCANFLWSPDIRLYCAIGHRYQDQELSVINRQKADVIIDNRLNLGDLERPDSIIPLRNLYLIMVASHYGDVIGLGALEGEVNPDKSEKFRIECESILNTCYSPSYWCDRHAFTVVYPVAKYSKAELIKEYLKSGGCPEKLLNETRSCYSDGDNHCGICSACVKRYIALKLNGLSENYLDSPSDSPYLKTIKTRWETFNYNRKSEILSVFPDLFNG